MAVAARPWRPCVSIDRRLLVAHDFTRTDPGNSDRHAPYRSPCLIGHRADVQRGGEYPCAVRAPGSGGRRAARPLRDRLHRRRQRRRHAGAAGRTARALSGDQDRGPVAQFRQGDRADRRPPARGRARGDPDRRRSPASAGDHSAAGGEMARRLRGGLRGAQIPQHRRARSAACDARVLLDFRAAVRRAAAARRRRLPAPRPPRGRRHQRHARAHAAS